jgi:uncharacterized delta-60 repeat protein
MSSVLNAPLWTNLTAALSLVEEGLQYLVTSPEFQSSMSLAFGKNHDYRQFKAIFNRKARDVRTLIEIVPLAYLNGAYGAFSRDTNKIYLASEFISSATPSAIADVLLEEYGHYIDAQLNPVETLGDEGEIFADLVQGNLIDPAAFTEDDTEIVNINGNWITVEQAAGDLDPTFGENGLVRTLVNGLEQVTVSGIKVQADGKIVIAGTANQLNFDICQFSNFVVIRYNSDGTFDTTFNNGSIGYTDVIDRDIARSLALQPDGKIVVSGYSYDTLGPTSHVTIIRYNSDGSLDTSFSGDGIARTTFDNAAYASGYDSPVVIQPDGKILIVG